MPYKPNMLMHACCANCSLHPHNLLKKDYDITLYYFNPNINQRNEYKKRLESIRFICYRFNIPLIIGRYKVNKWNRAVLGLEREPEGGKRCLACFKFRLFETAGMAKKMGFDKFCTTLSVSPHKDAKAIDRIGTQAGSYFNVDYLNKDFKKEGGFKKTMQMSRNLGLYRQNYCGCSYSRK